MFNDQDAQVIGRRIKTIRPDGHITTQELLEDASDKASPIHKYFEWDTNKAATLYRLRQAQHIITHIKVIVITKGSPIAIKAYHHVKIENSGKGYVEAEVVANNKDYYHQVLDGAISELHGWQDRYKAYKELRVIFKAIPKIKTRKKRKSA